MKVNLNKTFFKALIIFLTMVFIISHLSLSLYKNPKLHLLETNQNIYVSQGQYDNLINCWRCHTRINRLAAPNCSGCGWDICPNCQACSFNCRYLENYNYNHQSSNDGNGTIYSLLIIAGLVYIGYVFYSIFYKDERL